MAIYRAPVIKYLFGILFFFVKGCMKFCRLIAPLISAVRFRALIKNAGSGCSCHYSVEIKYPEKISLGDSTRIGPKSTLGGFGGIKIGSNVVVSKNVLIESAGLDFKNNTVPYSHKAMPIIIEDEVWIGANAIILGGVTIGKGSIVGAGAVISKSLPEKSIVVQSAIRMLGNKI